jgi:hypothetical protein
MQDIRFPIRPKPTTRTPALKEAIVASFALDPDPAQMRLAGFDESDWHSVLWWLDIGGMATCFYLRACEIGVDRFLPPGVEADLALRLSNNRIRTKAILDEARALATWFQTGNIPHALSKGVTLDSVEASAPGIQADLDFLIAERSVGLAIHYVHRLGYRLQTQSANTLEFRAGAITVPSFANIYSVNTRRALVLHLAREGSGECQMLARRVMCEFGGPRFYALSPADILVEQARHLFKQLCGEYVRLYCLLEFWRHVTARRRDTGFWHRVGSCAAEFAHGDLAMGMAYWLAEDLFGRPTVEIPLQWRADALPVRVRLWLERYARSVLLSDTMGNRLYALLRMELLGNARHHRTTCQILLPRVSPATLLETQPNQSRSPIWVRYYIESRLVLRRLCFQLREGLRFAVEASRWSRAVARIGR